MCHYFKVVLFKTGRCIPHVSVLALGEARNRGGHGCNDCARLLKVAELESDARADHLLLPLKWDLRGGESALASTKAKHARTHTHTQ